MKIFQYSIVFILLSILSGCNHDFDPSEIKVGMTYDEVENILNKPVSITRGVNELYYDIEELPMDVIRKINTDSISQNKNLKRWIVPHQVRTIGNLIYVTWVYNKTKTDTFYILMNSFKEITDTIKNKIPIYYIGNRQVSEKEYNKFDGYEYRLQNNKITDKDVYESYKKSGLYKLPTPAKREKKIEYKYNTSIGKKQLLDKVERKYFIVHYSYCVVFDASSGRVTLSDYFPTHIDES